MYAIMIISFSHYHNAFELIIKSVLYIHGIIFNNYIRVNFHIYQPNEIIK